MSDIPLKWDRGIRTHNWLTAFFVNLFGTGTIQVSDTNGKSYLYNKGSLVKWINSSSDYAQGLPFTEKVDLTVKDDLIKAAFIHNVGVLKTHYESDKGTLLKFASGFRITK